MKYNWQEIQAAHDAGLTWREIITKFGCSMSTLVRANQAGRFKSRAHKEAVRLRISTHGGRPHTDESKRRIALARREYLIENPEKVPYRLNHSSQESYPEKLFRAALIESNITGWIAKYRAGIYEYDFAFPEKRIDVEIDGGTHLQEHVKQIDARRDQWTREQGWTVLRFTAQAVKTDIVGCLTVLCKHL